MRTTIPLTDLSIYPLCLGGNVFGWSADEAQSHDVLDAFVSHGGNFIDTADCYTEWIEGNHGGESEKIIGSWIKKRQNRERIIIATKVAKFSQRPGLKAQNIKAAVDDSLNRLQTDYIDIYYAHEDDQTTPLEETLEAFTEVIQSKKVRYIAASNYSANRLEEALRVSQVNGFAQYIAIQNHYNLVERTDYELAMTPILQKYGISGFPYFALARGFLTGKYRENEIVESVRFQKVSQLFSKSNFELLKKLEILSQKYNTTISAISLGWLRSQPTISAPIASARTVEQLHEIMPLITLTKEELASL